MMRNPFDYNNSQLFRADTTIAVPYAYDIVNYDRSEEPDVGNTSPYIEYAGVFTSDGERTFNFNYNASSTNSQSLQVRPFGDAVFKLKPKPQYTFTIRRNFWDAEKGESGEWDYQLHIVTSANPLEFPAPSEWPRLNLVFEAIDEDVTIVPGCTDPDAENYDPSATMDDNSCTYPEEEEEEEEPADTTFTPLTGTTTPADEPEETNMNKWIAIGVVALIIVGGIAFMQDSSIDTENKVK